MDRAVSPGLLYKLKVFPITKLRLQQIDTEQRKCVASTLRIQRRPGEEILAFCMRKNQAATRVIKRTGLRSSKVAEQTVKWDGHLARNSCAVLWPALLAPTRDATWLWFRRAANPSWRSRTATRAFRGHVAQRWQAGVQEAKNHLLTHPVIVICTNCACFKSRQKVNVKVNW